MMAVDSGREHRLNWRTCLGVAMLVYLAVGSAILLMDMADYGRRDVATDASGQCIANLRTIGEAVTRYASAWHALPGSLEAVLPDARSQLLPHVPVSGQAASEYIYVDWSNVLTPAQAARGGYPLAFDARTDFHGLPGVYILMTDCLLIWDEDTAWLRRFSSDHPELEPMLLLPGSPDVGGGKPKGDISQ